MDSGLGTLWEIRRMPGTRARVCWSRETRFVLRCVCVCVRGQTADSELGDFTMFDTVFTIYFSSDITTHPWHTHDTSIIVTPAHAAHTPQPASSQSPRPRPSPSAHASAPGYPPRARSCSWSRDTSHETTGREPRPARRGPGHFYCIVYFPCTRLSGVCADPSQNKWVCRSTVSTVTH